MGTNVKKKIIIIVIIVLAITVYLGIRGRRPTDDGQPVALKAKVEEGPLLISVRASGEIRSKTSSKVIPGIKRGENVAFLVPEGSHVTNGQTVAQLSTDDMDRRILDAELKVSDADAKLLGAKTDHEIQILDNATAMTTAVQAVQSADLTLREFMEGNMPMQIKTADLKVATAASEYDRSTKKFVESEQILKQGFITEDQLEEERIKLETAKVNRETSVEELKNLKLYTLPLKEAEARNVKMKAYSDLEKTKKKNDVQLQTKFQAMEQSKAILQKATNDLGQLREDLLAYNVKSPSDGIVTYGDADASWRRAEIQVGMTLMPGEALMTIPDLSALQAVVDVPEADIPKVKVGQRATVNMEAVANRIYKGKVERVAEIANPGGFLEAAVKQFKVNIALDQTVDLRPGFSCDVEILIETLPKVLKVPIQAVFNEGGEFVAYVDSALGPTRTPVKVGRSSITSVEILGGLKKGQSVYLNKPGAKKPGEPEERKS